ncbi:MAG: PqqD family peptide modification chaperone [Actinophytocola sp.]|uniref:PqqD family protein n=1 Tax=Actinophytocola sp. TaxID=1872138 RepID=UPI00132C279D|nr:PqqD family protein [Actinophytocola sp.]MPZ79823.1 PqqD family peptide modification chaperone [Actinophytocola sp.]
MRLRSTDISARTIGAETIILSLPNSRYFSVTGIGTRVFEFLGEDRSLDDLVEVIVGEYEVDAATARRDVEAFVGRLREAELLH